MIHRHEVKLYTSHRQHTVQSTEESNIKLKNIHTVAQHNGSICKPSLSQNKNRLQSFVLFI